MAESQKKVVITLRCLVCGKQHINTYAVESAEVSIQPGHYGGYMARAYQMLCGHYCLLTTVTKGGYTTANEVLCTIEQLSEEALLAVRRQLSASTVNPANYVGEKL